MVAVGSAGTLLERDGGEWHLVGDAGKLVAGQDFTAAASLADGTLLAAAGGEVIQGTGAGSWQRAPIAPLGVGVLKLAGYRDGSGALHALVLTAGADGLALLDGDGTGWRPVASPAGFVLSDFAVDETTRKLWLAGSDGQGTGTIELNLPADGGGDPPPPASPSNLLRSLGL